ncbi:MAG: hypothetical protein ACK51L_03695 [bacterium]
MESWRSNKLIAVSCKFNHDIITSSAGIHVATGDLDSTSPV